MLFLQLPGTILPVFLLPSVVWNTFPYGLTLEGQYIVKNLVLVGAALALGSQIRYDEQLARQSENDWSNEFEDEDYELVATQLDQHWPKDTIGLAPTETDNYDGYLPYDETPTERLDYGLDQYSQQHTPPPPLNQQSVSNQRSDQQQSWHPYQVVEPTPNVQVPGANLQKPPQPQKQEAYDSFWSTNAG